MTTPAASTDTTNTNAGQSFKIGVSSTTANINSAYGSLGAFPYLTADNRPDSTNLADLYLKVWQDSTTYTAIKNGWSVVSGDSATTLKAFSTAMSSATDPWSDYRFAILNKIDLSAYASQHSQKFIFSATAPTVAAGYYNDHFVGYCIYQDTKGGICAEAAVESTWDSYIDFTAPKAAPVFTFAAARFLSGSALLKIGTATDTDHSPVGIVTAESTANKTGQTALQTANTTEISTTDTFVGTAETFAQSRLVAKSREQISDAAAGGFVCSGDSSTQGVATGTAVAGCGNGTAKFSATLATTNLDYVAAGQSGFKMIGAGASYKAGAMWTYLWGWVPTTTTTNQTSSHDLTFESGVKTFSWAATRDIVLAANAGNGQTGCGGTGCATGSNNCPAACRPATLPVAAIPVRTARDLNVTRVAMSGSSLVASAAAAIVAASLAF